MKTLKYGYIGEDKAQAVFLQNYLEEIENVVFEKDEAFCKRFYAKNKAMVNNLYPEFIQIGFNEYRQDVFFVCRDFDDFDAQLHQQKLEEWKQGIWEQFRENTVFFVPVQAIEYWLWYLKDRQENPASTKNKPIEKQTRATAKEKVYGSRSVSNAKSIPLVEKLSTHIDVAFLESRSESFKAFHTQVKKYLAQQEFS